MLPLVFRAFGSGGVGCVGWGFVLLPCVGTLPLVFRAFGSGGVGCGGWVLVLLPCAGMLPPSVEPCGCRSCPIPTDGVRDACFSFTSSHFFLMSTLILLRRTAHLPGGTEGVLFFPAESGQSPIATLEPPASGAHPAIPAGEYPLRLDVVSPRFARSPRRWSAAWGARLPRLMQVPGREGILIHPGNRPADSSGCVLIGRAVGPLRLAESVATFHRLMHVLHRLPPPLRLRVVD